MASIPSSLTLLLVEDAGADALWMQEMLDSSATAFETARVSRLAEAIRALRGARFDLVMLDLGRPDCHGEGSLRSLREAQPGVPVVVLTGARGFGLGVRCVHLGAQDSLSEREELEADDVHRSIHHAIGRSREQEPTVPRRELGRRRRLDFGVHPHAALPIRSPDAFARLAEADRRLLPVHAAAAAEVGEERSRGELTARVDHLHEEGCRPEDLLGLQLPLGGAARRGSAERSGASRRFERAPRGRSRSSMPPGAIPANLCRWRMI